MKRFFFAFIVVCFFINCKRSQHAADLFSIKLFSPDQIPFEFSQIKNNKASVFIFLATDCPLSQNYTLTLNNLNDDFKNDSIGFYGIIPGKNVSAAEVNEYINKYKISFSILADPDLVLTNYFNATKTPEVFAVNTKGNILYKGAIDNWASDLGQHRIVITEYYLKDALSSINQNKEVSLKETKAVGCFIEQKK